MTRRRKYHQRYSKRSKKRQAIVSSNSTITQLALLHISIDSNSKPFEFIQRHELTRQHALTMPVNQRPIISIVENDVHQDYYSSYV